MQLDASVLKVTTRRHKRLLNRQLSFASKKVSLSSFSFPQKLVRFCLAPELQRGLLRIIISLVSDLTLIAFKQKVKKSERAANVVTCRARPCRRLFSSLLFLWHKSLVWHSPAPDAFETEVGSLAISPTSSTHHRALILGVLDHRLSPPGCLPLIAR